MLSTDDLLVHISLKVSRMAALVSGQGRGPLNAGTLRSFVRTPSNANLAGKS